MLKPDNYVFEETLREGTHVTLRAVRADDGPKIRREFRNLDRDTVYNRFFGYKTDVSDTELSRITNADFERDVALLVTIGSGDDESVIGGASYFTVDADLPARSAELAFTVVQDYQGRGIASLLMRYLARIARQNDLTRVEAGVLAHNISMLTVFKQSGLPMTVRRDDQAVHVTLCLKSAPARRNA